jgi:hypothetical protein
MIDVSLLATPFEASRVSRWIHERRHRATLHIDWREPGRSCNTHSRSPRLRAGPIGSPGMNPGTTADDVEALLSFNSFRLHPELRIPSVFHPIWDGPPESPSGGDGTRVPGDGPDCEQLTRTPPHRVGGEAGSGELSLCPLLRTSGATPMGPSPEAATDGVVSTCVPRGVSVTDDPSILGSRICFSSSLIPKWSLRR